MSLPETIWWCEEHRSFANNRYQCFSMASQDYNGECFGLDGCVIEIELRVAGRDDLLIRREDYDAAVERAYQMFRSWLIEDNDAPLRSAVKAALAAAEGPGEEESRAALDELSRFSEELELYEDELNGDCETDCQEACAYPGQFTECEL